VLVVAYSLIPTKSSGEGSDVPWLILELCVFGVVVGIQLPAIVKAKYPVLRAAEALAILVPLYLLIFAQIYLWNSLNDPAAFIRPRRPRPAQRLMVGTAGGRRPGHRVTSAAAPVLWDPGTASTSVMTKVTVSAGIKPGTTVAVVGDGAVGLCGVLAASELGAERVIAMSRPSRVSSSPRSSAPPTSCPSAVTRASPASRN
jgi:hypothetical protein